MMHLHRASEKLQDTAIELLGWWLDGLWLGVPRRLRRTWLRTRDRLLIRFEGDKVGIEHVDGDSGEVTESLRLALDEGDVASELKSRISNCETARVTLLLPSDAVLQTVLSMPLAAEAELRAVLYHELDRLIPFAIEDVVFDYQVTARDAAQGTVSVAVALIQLRVLVDLEARLERLGLHAARLAVTSSDGTIAPFNLSRRRRRLRLPFVTPKLRPGLVVAAGLALLLALYLPTMRYEALITQYQLTVAALRDQAVAARAALDQQETTLNRTRFLEELRRDYVAPAELLLELTDRLPDDTWLSRLTLDSERLVLEGESPAASTLLELVESVETLEHAEFQASVARSNESGKERFTIVATLRRTDP